MFLSDGGMILIKCRFYFVISTFVRDEKSTHYHILLAAEWGNRRS